jgi:hypothetical protein
VSIFPLRQGEWYSLGQLREEVKAILNRTRSDKEFGHGMRVNDQRLVPWAKPWMEEIYPSSLLADRLGLADDVRFRWTPNAAADVELRSAGRAIKIQCTTAYPHWPNSLGEQGGHLHKLEMRELNEKGYMFPGGGTSKATPHDVETDLETPVRRHLRCIGKKDQGRLRRLLVAHLRVRRYQRLFGCRFSRGRGPGNSPSREGEVGGGF